MTPPPGFSLGRRKWLLLCCLCLSQPLFSQWVPENTGDILRAFRSVAEQGANAPLDQQALAFKHFPALDANLYPEASAYWEANQQNFCRWQDRFIHDAATENNMAYQRQTVTRAPTRGSDTDALMRRASPNDPPLTAQQIERARRAYHRNVRSFFRENHVASDNFMLEHETSIMPDPNHTTRREWDQWVREASARDEVIYHDPLAALFEANHRNQRPYTLQQADARVQESMRLAHESYAKADALTRKAMGYPEGSMARAHLEWEAQKAKHNAAKYLARVMETGDLIAENSQIRSQSVLDRMLMHDGDPQEVLNLLSERRQTRQGLRNAAQSSAARDQYIQRAAQHYAINRMNSAWAGAGADNPVLRATHVRDAARMLKQTSTAAQGEMIEHFRLTHGDDAARELARAMRVIPDENTRRSLMKGLNRLAESNLDALNRGNATAANEALEAMALSLRSQTLTQQRNALDSLAQKHGQPMAIRIQQRMLSLRLQEARLEKRKEWLTKHGAEYVGHMMTLYGFYSSLNRIEAAEDASKQGGIELGQFTGSYLGGKASTLLLGTSFGAVGKYTGMTLGAKTAAYGAKLGLKFGVASGSLAGPLGQVAGGIAAGMIGGAVGGAIGAIAGNTDSFLWEQNLSEEEFNRRALQASAPLPADVYQRLRGHGLDHDQALNLAQLYQGGSLAEFNQHIRAIRKEKNLREERELDNRERLEAYLRDQAWFRANWLEEDRRLADREREMESAISGWVGMLQTLPADERQRLMNKAGVPTWQAEEIHQRVQAFQNDLSLQAARLAQLRAWDEHTRGLPPDLRRQALQSLGASPGDMVELENYARETRQREWIHFLAILESLDAESRAARMGELNAIQLEELEKIRRHIAGAPETEHVPEQAPPPLDIGSPEDFKGVWVLDRVHHETFTDYLFNSPLPQQYKELGVTDFEHRTSGSMEMGAGRGRATVRRNSVYAWEFDEDGKVTKTVPYSYSFELEYFWSIPPLVLHAGDRWWGPMEFGVRKLRADGLRPGTGNDYFYHALTRMLILLDPKSTTPHHVQNDALSYIQPIMEMYPSATGWRLGRGREGDRPDGKWESIISPPGTPGTRAGLPHGTEEGVTTLRISIDMTLQRQRIFRSRNDPAEAWTTVERDLENAFSPTQCATLWDYRFYDDPEEAREAVQRAWERQGQHQTRAQEAQVRVLGAPLQARFGDRLNLRAWSLHTGSSYRYVWNSEPSLAFAQTISNQAENEVTLTRAGELLVWVELQQRSGANWETLAQSPAVRVEVPPPQVDLHFLPAPAEARVGQPVHVLLRPPSNLDSAEWHFTWLEPADIFTVDASGWEVRFTPADETPVPLRAEARWGDHPEPSLFVEEVFLVPPDPGETLEELMMEWIEKGWQLENEDDLAQALECYQIAFRLKALPQLEERIEALKTEIEHRKQAVLLLQEGEILASQGKLEEALVLWLQAEQLHASLEIQEYIQRVRRRLRALELKTQGDREAETDNLQAALAAYNSAQLLDPTLLLHTRIHELSQRLDAETRARQLVELAHGFELQKNLPAAIDHYERSLGWLANKAVEDRIRELKLFLQLDNLLWDARWHEQEENWEDAIETYGQMLRLQPNHKIRERMQELHAHVHVTTAQSKEAEGDWSGAMMAYMMARNVRPSPAIQEKIEEMQRNMRSSRLMEEGYNR
ncbi:MAG: tetratricopeptide repeat protein [Verrucomicrobia bacterium]|nr:tetratricopeptide repeat protein [Verrucomicrobiota bacterium]MCH8510750.1 tetratricopeptide repeat protein [Kiritimatiellia bacterium]